MHPFLIRHLCCTWSPHGRLGGGGRIFISVCKHWFLINRNLLMVLFCGDLNKSCHHLVVSSFLPLSAWDTSAAVTLIALCSLAFFKELFFLDSCCSGSVLVAGKPIEGDASTCSASFVVYYNQKRPLVQQRNDIL